MSWPWTRRPPQASEDAVAAATHARRAVEDTDALAARVSRATTDLAATRARNHFAAAVERSIIGRT